MATLIIIGVALMWLLTSGFIYLGVLALKYMNIMPEAYIFTFENALNIGEIIALAFIAAGIGAFILNAIGLIDLSALKVKRHKA